ncbi:MAG TPA: hypothetical protein VFX59_20940 [Polyangiales bacterium]|nr:hypothetical protein [Polyangiales bacterium]
MDRPGAAGRRSSYVHIIRDQLALPDADARTGFTQLLRKRHAELGCVAIVVGGTGFWASAMRNAVIGLRLLGPRDFEFRLYGTADELVEWLPAAHQRLTGVSIAPVTLRQLLSTAQET